MSDAEGQALAMQPARVRSTDTRTAWCKNSVNRNGASYATLDAHSKDDTVYECQRVYLTLPSQWSVAPDNADSTAVTAAYNWGTHVLVYAGGSGRWTKYKGSDAAGSLWASSGRLSSSVDQYKPSGCNYRILIKTTSVATCDCPAGEFALTYLPTSPKRGGIGVCSDTGVRGEGAAVLTVSLVCGRNILGGSNRRRRLHRLCRR